MFYCFSVFESILSFWQFLNQFWEFLTVFEPRSNFDRFSYFSLQGFLISGLPAPLKLCLSFLTFLKFFYRKWKSIPSRVSRPFEKTKILDPFEKNDSVESVVELVIESKLNPFWLLNFWSFVCFEKSTKTKIHWIFIRKHSGGRNSGT